MLLVLNCRRFVCLQLVSEKFRKQHLLNGVCRVKLVCMSVESY